ncbi:putative methyltransferase-domain-containing protein [Amylostereum chailletii]|nr:putative methyltransferase-domain-containing protein [Amylostereum chailletii]
MPKTLKRKAPVTVIAKGPSGVSSNPHSSRTLIRRFHTLLKNQTQLQSEPRTLENAQALADISKEMGEMGGLPAYQRMSTIGQGKDRGGGTEKVLIGWMKEIGLSNASKTNERHRLLEVGALKPDNYAACKSWLDVTPIDLCSRHPDIQEQDFLRMDLEQHRERWDAISLSLVVNFVPDARDRGRMLCLARSMLRSGGVLFLALPLSCLMNSRYTTLDHHKSLMEAIGFVQTHERWKKGGKMIYFLYRKADPVDGHHDIHQFHKKVVLRQGNRNNFVILLS